MKTQSSITERKVGSSCRTYCLLCRLGYEHMNEQVSVRLPLPEGTRAQTKKRLGGRSFYCCGLALVNAALESTTRHISFPLLVFLTAPLFLHREDHRCPVFISAAHEIKRKVIKWIPGWSLCHSSSVRFLSRHSRSALPSTVVLPV